MERLTDWYKGDAYYPKCFESPCDGMGCPEERCDFRDLKCKRLAEYEDTGLTPEEIKVLKDFLEENVINILLQEIDGSNWIPIKERLPEEGDEVLASTSRHVYTVKYYSDYGFLHVDNVIAWQPSPAPYKPQTLANTDNDTAQPGLMPGE